MGWMNDVFGGGFSNPANAAQSYLDKIPGYTNQYMQPYIDTGMEAGNIAQDQYSKWVQDPYGSYNEIFSNYNTSPWYDYQSDQMREAASNSAAAGGYAGTEADYNNQMETENALLNKDFDNYMNYILGMQNQGMQGEQQMYNTGFNASNNALNSMNNYATQSAANQFGGTQSSNAMSSGMMGNLMQLGGLGLGFAML